MVTITTSDTTATFEIEGMDKLWSLKSRLEIPLAHIRGVCADPEVALLRERIAGGSVGARG